MKIVLKHSHDVKMIISFIINILYMLSASDAKVMPKRVCVLSYLIVVLLNLASDQFVSMFLVKVMEFYLKK